MVTIHRILAATDFSEYSKEAVKTAIYFGKSFGADLYLVHVFEPAYVSPGGVLLSVLPEEVHTWVKELREEETRKLNAAAEEARKEIPRVETLFKTGMPFVEIIKAAEEIPADLIILGTHGRTGLAHVLLGSVAERVVRKASCPVLTIRPKALTTGGE
jgi:universal stress protein A